jgi:NitT/TauT family transport system ATP-binding protein
MDVIVDGVTQIWGEDPTQVVALDRFSHHFRSGRFSCLLGPSGCGKSTLIQIVGGLEPATHGTVRVHAPGRADDVRRLGADSVMVWQNLNLFPWRDVIDNVAFGLEMRGVNRAERHERAAALLASVGLRGFERHLPGQLSGGMRQRVAIARALALDPQVLMMDEPFGALDAITREEMSRGLLDIWERTGKTIVLVTHSIDEAIFLSGEVHIMGTGPARIIETLPITLPQPRTGDSFTDPAFKTAQQRLRGLLIESHQRRPT